MQALSLKQNITLTNPSSCRDPAAGQLPTHWLEVRGFRPSETICPTCARQLPTLRASDSVCLSPPRPRRVRPAARQLPAPRGDRGYPAWTGHFCKGATRATGQRSRWPPFAAPGAAPAGVQRSAACALRDPGGSRDSSLRLRVCARIASFPEPKMLPASREPR